MPLNLTMTLRFYSKLIIIIHFVRIPFPTKKSLRTKLHPTGQPKYKIYFPIPIAPWNVHKFDNKMGWRKSRLSHARGLIPVLSPKYSDEERFNHFYNFVNNPLFRLTENEMSLMEKFFSFRSDFNYLKTASSKCIKSLFWGKA